MRTILSNTALATIGTAAIFAVPASAQEFIPQPALTDHPLPACEGGYAAYGFSFERGDCAPLSYSDYRCAETPGEAFQRIETSGPNYTGLAEWTPISITVELDVFGACTEHGAEAFLYSTFMVDRISELEVSYDSSDPAGDAFVSMRNMDLGTRIDPFVSEPRYRTYRLLPGVVYRADMVSGSYPYEPHAASSSGSATITAVLVSSICEADIDGDGELTLFDFLGFQNLFDAGDLRADFDGDGELTLFDFLAFQNAFDAGCP